MHITIDRDDVQTLYNAELMPDGYDVRFSENNTANVKEEVGERLIEQYGEISEHTE